MSCPGATARRTTGADGSTGVAPSVRTGRPAGAVAPTGTVTP